MSMRLKTFLCALFGVLFGYFVCIFTFHLPFDVNRASESVILQLTQEIAPNVNWICLYAVTMTQKVCK